MEIIKENENVELVNNGKHLNFSLNDLDFLKVSLTNDNKEKMWINEKFTKKYECKKYETNLEKIE